MFRTALLLAAQPPARVVNARAGQLVGTPPPLLAWVDLLCLVMCSTRSSGAKLRKSMGRGLRVCARCAVASAMIIAAMQAQNPGESQVPAGQNPLPANGQRSGAGPAAGSVSAQELSNQVNNPAAPVAMIQFRDILLPDVSGASGTINALQLQPVLPVAPFRVFPFFQLIKVTIPVALTFPGVAPPVGCVACGSGTKGATGVGDLQVFDIISFKQSWGRWGFGPTFYFPTASAAILGSGKYQAGPAFALMYTGLRNFIVGAVVQNPVSFAGSPHRQAVNQMLVTPTATYTLAGGWFAGLSDYNWSWNWRQGGAATIPIGMQVGKVLKVGRQPFSLAVEAGGVAVKPAGSPRYGWILGFELSPIFSFHLGPHEKVRVRGKDLSK
jgi:hypothetical protein